MTSTIFQFLFSYFIRPARFCSEIRLDFDVFQSICSAKLRCFAQNIGFLTILGSLLFTTSCVAQSNSLSGDSMKWFVGTLNGDVSLAMAARLAKDGDTVWIRAGQYHGQVASWPQSNLKIRGLGGPVILKAAGTSAEGKAIFVTKGDNVEIDAITFEDCVVSDRNGAGIRHEGGYLKVINSRFRNNEQGILTGNKTTQSLEVVNSVFTGNGTPEGFSHGIYVGRIAFFKLEGSYIADSRGGHLVKSRARVTEIKYNRLSDENGKGSVKIDLPEGGDVLVLGNIVEHGLYSENSHVFAYGFERTNLWSNNSIKVIHNTIIINRLGRCDLIFIQLAPLLKASNNLISGRPCNSGDLTPEQTRSFVRVEPNVFISYSELNLSINELSLAEMMNKSRAAELTSIDGPRFQYQHPASHNAIVGQNMLIGAIQNASLPAPK